MVGTVIVAVKGSSTRLVTITIYFYLKCGDSLIITNGAIFDVFGCSKDGDMTVRKKILIGFFAKLLRQDVEHAQGWSY